MKRINEPHFTALIATTYAALMLVLMEYFFLPFRVESWLNPTKFRLGASASLNSGIIWATSCFVLFLVIPVLIIKFALRERTGSYGFSTKDFKKHLRIYLLAYAFMLPLIYVASTLPEFTNTYPFIASTKRSLSHFIIWELFYILQFFSLEFFFRGYLLYSLERTMDRWLAISIMVIPYAMIHFHKPFIECLGAIFAGFFLGHLSLKYRTWMGGALLHALVAITMDLLSVYSYGLFS